MTGRVRVNCFAVSADGFGAGPDQSLDQPLGRGGEGLHRWFFPTRSCRENFGQTGGEEGIDDDFGRRGMAGLGAWILGRNMFGPIRGDWPDDAWKGWWGAEPPYHVPVLVLTNHAREPIEMQGGTVFISRPAASRPRWSGRAPLRATGTSASAAGPTPSGSTCERV